MTTDGLNIDFEDDPPPNETIQRYGRPENIDAGDALRTLGFRDHIHPADVIAWRYPSEEAARAFAKANKDKYDRNTYGPVETDEGWISAVDLVHRGGPRIVPTPTNPAYADDHRSASIALWGHGVLVIPWNDETLEIHLHEQTIRFVPRKDAA
jgi:hypothetical protein